MQAITSLYFLTVLIGGAVALYRVVQRDLPLIGAALAGAPSPARIGTRSRTSLPETVRAR